MVKSQIVQLPGSEIRFDYGAGRPHLIRPSCAVDLGLVYDLNMHGYFNFMCTIGNNRTGQISKVQAFDSITLLS
ncbi:hypothetical protein Dimus_037708 [Dionaea muscipula]